MRQLTIKDFSCIKSATIDFNRLTILIGPQASGKSVICKLSYFFIDIINFQNDFIGNGSTFQVYKEFIAKKFSEWFPESAWGDKKFQIEFTAGDYKISLNRITYRKKVNADFRIKVSDEFQKNYEDMVLLSQKQSLGKKETQFYAFERDYEFRHMVRKSSQALLKKDYLDSQLFIPAGRSFFTSIGKAVAAFEQGRVLDPLIIRFGRVFAAYKTLPRHKYIHDEEVRGMVAAIEDLFAKLMGGTLVVTGDEEVVVCPDGRRMPLSTLSSGQQELLPLVSVLPHLISKGTRQAIYIEEPEAHLFPSAQSELIEIFATFLTKAGLGTNMILTTHSPYVLVKVNNLIKAGQLGRSTNVNKRNAVSKIIDRQFWLRSNAVSAYAIRDGVLTKIIDKDGMIDADYLDNVSGDLSKEFMQLLEVEISK